MTKQYIERVDPAGLKASIYLGGKGAFRKSVQDDKWKEAVIDILLDIHELLFRLEKAASQMEKALEE